MKPVKSGIDSISKYLRSKKEVGRRFKLFRDSLNMSRQQLVDELQVGESIIKHIECGHCFPGILVQIGGDAEASII